MEGYGMYNNNICTECFEDNVTYILIGTVLLVKFLGLLIMIRSAIRSAYRSKSLLSVYIRILMNYE